MWSDFSLSKDGEEGVVVWVWKVRGGFRCCAGTTTAPRWVGFFRHVRVIVDISPSLPYPWLGNFSHASLSLYPALPRARNP